MLLSKEICRDGQSTFRKQTFYNDKKEILGILEKTIMHDSSAESGNLLVYEYNGQNYRIIRFESGSKSYNNFKPGHLLAGKRDWYNMEDAVSTREHKFEQGLLVADHYHNIRFSYKELVDYTYKDGLKISETSTKEDGSVYKSVFTYEKGNLLSKYTTLNGQYLDIVTYVYLHGKLVQEEQALRYRNTQYCATRKKYFYAGNELAKTEYYGTYAGKFPMYKVEETIRKGNTVTRKASMIPNLETMIGYYDLAALHEWLKKENMDWALPIYTKDFLATATLDAVNCQIDTFDDKGNVTAMRIMHPENHTQEMTKMQFRNEYNDNGQLEFTIVYGQTEAGQLEEREIRKYYYLD